MVHFKLWVIIEFLECGSCHNLLEAHVAVVCPELLLGLDYLRSGEAAHHDVRVAHILFEEDLKLLGTPFEQHWHLSLHLLRVRTPSLSRFHIQDGARPTQMVFIPSHLNFVAFLLKRHAVRLVFPQPTRHTCIPPHLEHQYLYLLGNYSRSFKDSVSLRLTEDPSAVSFPSKHEV